MEFIIKKVAGALLSFIFLFPLYTAVCIWRGSEGEFFGPGIFDSRADAVFVLALAVLGAVIFFYLVFGS